MSLILKAVTRTCVGIATGWVCLFAPSVAQAIELPVAGINLAGYSYWGTAFPFVDVAHMGNRWVSTPTDGSTWNDDRVIPITSSGYPSSLESGQFAKSLVFTHNGGVFPTGQYILTWEGDGDVRLRSDSGVNVVASGSRQITYNVTATNPVGLPVEITKTNSENPVHNIRVIAPFEGATETFNPKYKQDLSKYGVIRYMDWNATNNSIIEHWTDRSHPQDAHWGGSTGVPYEYQIQLSNELGQDLWLTVPHLADDDYVRSLAQLVHQQLAPGLRVWVEYSNEVWNGSFEQYDYANDVLRPQYGVANAPQAYGRRSAEIFDIFAAETGDSSRLVRVIAGQNANSWILAQSILGATVNGELKADVAAVAPYFKPDIDSLYQNHLQGSVDLNIVFTELHNSIDQIATKVVENRNVAVLNGIPLVAYEGGQHLVARPGVQQNDASFVQLLGDINRDPRMGEMYAYLLHKWTESGGKTFTFFNDVKRSGKSGSWGLKETYLDDNAPKFRAVQEYLDSLNGLPGDFNKDSRVDDNDYSIWVSSFGSNNDLRADGSRNGLVDAADFVLWRDNWGTDFAAVVVLVPEPSGWLLMTIAVPVTYLAKLQLVK